MSDKNSTSNANIIDRTSEWASEHPALTAGILTVGGLILMVPALMFVGAIGDEITGTPILEYDPELTDRDRYTSFGVGLGVLLLLIWGVFAIWSLMIYLRHRTSLRNYLTTHSLTKWENFTEDPTSEDILHAIYVLNWSNEYRSMKAETRQLLWAFVIAVFGFIIALGADVFGVATALGEWLGWTA